MSDTKVFDFQSADIEKKLESMSVQDIEKEISLLVKAIKVALIARGENVDFYKDLLAKYEKNNTLGV